MMPKPRRSEFALEPLEPRLLLSTDGLSGLTPLPPDDPFPCDDQVLQERERIPSALSESPEEELSGLFAGLNDTMADLDAEDQGTSAAADDSRAEPESTVPPAADTEQASAPESSSGSGCNIDDVEPLFATENGLDTPSVNQTVHQLTAALLVANGPPDTRVHLLSLPGGLNWSDVSSGIRDQLDALGGVTGILNGLGDFADSLPLLGQNLGQLLDSASIIRDRISEGLVRSLFDGLPALVTDAVGVVTSRIRAWSGTSTDGARITAVEAENNPGPTRDHFWWDIRLTLALTGVDRALENVAGAVFGAVFTGTPEVNVETSLVLDFSFGYDDGFFVDLDALEARAEVHVDNLGELEFGVSFGSIGSLEVSAGNLDLVASVTVEPDAGVLDAAGRITMAGLTDATSVSDAFNLETDGNLRASLTLDGTLTFLGFELTGSATVGIRSDDLFNGQAPEFTLSVAGSLGVAGQSLGGTFTFVRTPTETNVQVQGLDLQLGVGGTQVFRAGNDSETLTFALLEEGGGYRLAGVASLTVTQELNIPNFRIDGSSLTLAFNTSAGSVSEIGGTRVDLAAGPYYRVSGRADLTLDNPGVTLTADFVFDPRESEIIVGVANLAFQFDNGSTPLLNVSGGSGAFIISRTGGTAQICGTATVSASLALADVEISGAFAVTFNNMASAQGERRVNVNGTEVLIPALTAGPYVRVAVTGATPGTYAELEVYGFGLSGNFVFESRSVSGAGGSTRKLITVEAEHVSFDLGNATSDLVQLTEGAIHFIISEAGVAGQGEISAALDLPNVSLAGRFLFRLNTTDAAATLDLPEGPVTLPTGPYLQISGCDLELAMFGIRVTGDLSIEKRESADGTELVLIRAADLGFNFGSDLLVASGGQATFVILDSGVAGQGLVPVTVSAFGGSFTYPFTWTFNRTGRAVDEIVDTEPVPCPSTPRPAAVPRIPSVDEMGDVLDPLLSRLDLPSGPFNRLSLDAEYLHGLYDAIPASLALNFDGFSFSVTSLVLEMVEAEETTPAYVKVGVGGLSFTLGTDSLGLDLSDGRGAFVIYRGDAGAGVAGDVRVSTVSLNTTSALSVTADDLHVLFNTTGRAVGPVTVEISEDASEDVVIEFTTDQADYLAVSGVATIALGIPGLGIDLGGNFNFQRSASGEIQVCAQELHFNLDIGGTSLASFDHGDGGFVILEEGFAGQAQLEFEAGFIGISGDISLEVNTTSAPVRQTVSVGSCTQALDLAANLFKITVSDGHFSIGSLSLPLDFSVEVITGSGPGAGTIEVWRRSTPVARLIRIAPGQSITEAISISDLLRTLGVDLDVLDFSNPGPCEWVSMLRQVLTWLEAFRDSSVFNTEIPFTGGFTVGEAFDWTRLFMDEIYSRLVSVELVASGLSSLSNPRVTGTLTDATFILQVGDFDAVDLMLSGAYTSDDLEALASEFNDLFSGVRLRVGGDDVEESPGDYLLLDELVEARLNLDEEFLVIALKPKGILGEYQLALMEVDDQFERLGFARRQEAGEEEAPEGEESRPLAVAAENARYVTQALINAIADLLDDGEVNGSVPEVYDAARREYTYLMDYTNALDYDKPLPFNFATDLGEIAGASLTGSLNLNVQAGFSFTLGFDLSARDVPRIISSPAIPVPSNGRISADAHFEIYLNGDEAHKVALTLPKADTDGNRNIDDLAADLNRVFADPRYEIVFNGTRTPLNQLIYAQKAANCLVISALQEDRNGNGELDPGEDLNGDLDPNPDNQLGVVNRITVRTLTTDVFATEMGFGLRLDETDTDRVAWFVGSANSPVKGLFLENVNLGGRLSLTSPGGIAGSLKFGFVEVSTSGGKFGTLAYDGVTAAPIEATVTLRNRTTGESRFYISELFDGTEDGNIRNMVPDFDFTGSFLASLSNIELKAGGLDLGSFLLSGNPEIKVWIPEITELEYNSEPYEEGATGIFVTYPQLADLQSFAEFNFTRLIKALNAIADALGQLSAFDFLDAKIPLVDMSVNEMLDYADKFAELIEAAGSNRSGSLQASLLELDRQVEQLFNLDSDQFTAELDRNGIYQDAVRTTGGTSSRASAATLNPNGTHNEFTVTAAVNGERFDGSVIRLLPDASLTGNEATADWDPVEKVLTIRINPDVTKANAIIAAVDALPDWSAARTADDDGASGTTSNTGDGTVKTLGRDDLRTAGGADRAHASTTINPRGTHNGFSITAADTGASLNDSIIRIVGDSAIRDNRARVEWNARDKLLTIFINPGVTTAEVVVRAINDGLTNWDAALIRDDDGDIATIGNNGGGTILGSALKFGFHFQVAYADSLPLQLDLKDLVDLIGDSNSAAKTFLEVATTLVQIRGSMDLTVSASAELHIVFGLDLTNPGDVRPFFYDETGATLLARVRGTDLELEASLGSIIGIFVRGGELTVDRDGNPETDPGDSDNPDKGAEFVLGLRDNNGDGRHYFNEDWLTWSSIDLHLTGGISATLPIYAPTETMALGGEEDEDEDGYPDNYLVLEVPDLVRLFVGDVVKTRAVGPDATVLFAGPNNDLQISGSTHSNHRIRFENSLTSGGAEARFVPNDPARDVADENTLIVRVQTDVTTADDVVEAFADSRVPGFTCTLTADDDGSTETTGNDGSGELEKLFVATPDFRALFADISFCDLIANSTGLLLDGLDKLLRVIQDGLNALVFSTELPLIGDGMSGAANFIERFREGFLKDLRDAVEEAGGNGLTALENAIKKGIWNSLGPGGIDILVDFETGEELDLEVGFSQLDVTLDCEDGLVVNVRLKEEYVIGTTDNPIDFDIGVRGFGLEVDGNVELAIGFDLKLGFGFNREDGFYFNSSAPADNPELRVYIEARIPELHVGGQLLFLQLDVSDDSEDPSHVSGEFVVDLKDPNRDGKLTFAEMSSSGLEFEDVIDFDLVADIEVNLDLAASFGGDAAFPRLLAEFHLGWEWTLDDGAGELRIEFTDIYLDLGTYISDFLAPILEKIRSVTEPLQPIIDVVTTPIPVISDLAGQPVTFLNLAEAFGLLEPSTIRFIECVLKVITLINDIEGIGEGPILIPFGSFALGEDDDGERRDIQPLEDLADRTMDDIRTLVDAADNPGVSSSQRQTTSRFMGNISSLDNFDIPIFDNPAELFNLFKGDPVRLIEWRMPTFKFEFTYTQSIPIFGPLSAQFGGTIGAKINIGFGYDTYGIQKYIESEDKKWWDILDGFYITDYDSSGNEQAELELYGELFAGLSLDLAVVEAGVTGGVGFTVKFDLHDVNDDGKIRVSELIANAKQDPRCIFDINGRIYLFLEAYLKIDFVIFQFERTWRLADLTLFEFTITCPQPVLWRADSADIGGETISGVYLNIGVEAGLREHVDTSDGPETFVLKHVSLEENTEKVEVVWGSYKAEFTLNTLTDAIVVVDAGEGDDFLDFRGIKTKVVVNGGEGNDTIYLSDGAGSKAYGGNGADTITASSELTATGVIIYGGNGNDILTGGSAAIQIRGDEFERGTGRDTILGSPENDSLYGGGDVDTIDGGGGDDYIEGNEGNDVIEGGDGNDFVLAGAGADRVRGSGGNDILHGGPGDDQLFGGSGSDLLLGGDGADAVYGHGGSDLLIGDQAEWIGEEGGGLAIRRENRIDLALLLAAIPTTGIAVSDLHGTGNDFLVGGGGGDVLFGGDGDDCIYGGNFIPAGETEVIEEDHNDFIDGGRGNDKIFGDDAMGRTGDRNTGIAIRSSIYYDNDQDGVRDDNETGFGHVRVELRTSDHSTVATEMTEVDGSFAFLGLDKGTYYLWFDLPAGLHFVPRYAVEGVTGPEDSRFDSDVDPAAQRTAQFTLAYDETETAIAAGYYGPAKVSVSDGSVIEGNAGAMQAVFAFTLSGIQSDVVEIAYETVAATASAASGDYLPVSGTLRFESGELTKQLSVTINSDSTYEPHEQFELKLLRARVRVRDASGTHWEDLEVNGETNLDHLDILGTILNDDPIPEISIQDYVPPSSMDPVTRNKVWLADEQDDASFVVTLSNPSQYPVQVEWRTDAAWCLGGTGCEASAGTPCVGGCGGEADFVMNWGTLTFEPGETSKRIGPIDLRDDDLDEEDETFFIDLFNPRFARIRDGRAVGIIPDDDLPVSVSIKPHPSIVPDGRFPFTAEVWEGNTTTTHLEFWIELCDGTGMPQASGKEVVVTYSTSPGTAVETVYSGDPASGPPDYEGLPKKDSPDELQTLVFAPGETRKAISLQVNSDTKPERDPEHPADAFELFFVNLLSARNADIARGAPAESNHVTVKILDDDTATVDYGPWAVWFTQPEYLCLEPDDLELQMPITIMRAPGSTNAVAVFSTYDGTADLGADYRHDPFRELIRFAEDEYSRTVYVDVLSDAEMGEGDETVRLYLNAPTGQAARGTPSEATLIIRDRDIPDIELTAVDSSVIEGDTGTRDYTFRIRLSSFPQTPVTVGYRTWSLTALGDWVAGTDFLDVEGEVTLGGRAPDGTPLYDQEHLVTVRVGGDITPELTETFALRLENLTPDWARLTDENQVVVGVIEDDDKKPVDGVVFCDRNGNGFMDYGELGIEGVTVRIDGVDHTTDPSGVFHADVFLGRLELLVDSDDTSHWSSGSVLFATGDLEATTANEMQVVQYEGIEGLSPFEPIGYRIVSTSAPPEASKDVGHGGTDDTLFGGPGNDFIDAGAGDDHVVGGHWMTATDSVNMPINIGDDGEAHYDADVRAVTRANTPSLHVVYDDGPIFEVDLQGVGEIRGEIWLDTTPNGIQDSGEAFLNEAILVHLLDCHGNIVDSTVATGTYAFTGLILNSGVESRYVVQFELPPEYTFVPYAPASEASDTDVVVAGRTSVITLRATHDGNLNDETETDVDAGIRALSTGEFYMGLPSTRVGFSEESYSVSESPDGTVVRILVERRNASDGRPVVVRTEDGTAVAGVNYTAVSKLVYLEPGQLRAVVEIPIRNTGMDLCRDALHFRVTLREATGTPLDTADVYISGAGSLSDPDDDTILGGEDWDIILGDSGQIPAAAVIANPGSLALIVYRGGPGKDQVSGGPGNDFLHGQLEDDLLAGDASDDEIQAGLGDDTIIAASGNDEINGDHGQDAVWSSRDVALTLLSGDGAGATLEHRRTVTDAEALSVFALQSIDVARLTGGPGNNRFDVTEWRGAVFIAGWAGSDVLLVQNDADMHLRHLTLVERLDVNWVYRFDADALITVGSDTAYYLSSLENITLIGGASDNTLTAGEHFSRPVTFIGRAGNDTLRGGAADDLFLFDADESLGTDVVLGRGGQDTLAFSYDDSNPLTFTETTAGVRVNLELTGSAQTVVDDTLRLILLDEIENVIGGLGNDHLTGNRLDNLLLGVPGDDTLAGGPGDETYAFDADLSWGHETIVENPGEGDDTLDFSATSRFSISINLSVTSRQAVNPNLALTICDEVGGEGEIESVIGGDRGDVIRGNRFANTLRGGKGNDLLDGKSGNDLLDGGPGDDRLMGGPGNDEISETADTHFALSDTSLARGTGEVDTLDGIEVANLTGGPSANRFTLTGWSGSGRIDGADDATHSRTDTLVLASDVAGMVLTDTYLDHSNTIILTTFTAETDCCGDVVSPTIEKVILTGGPGNNRIDASGYSGSAILSGGAGNDVLIGGAGSDELRGGPGNDTLTGNRGNDDFDGGSGLDVVMEDLSAFTTGAKFVLRDDRLVIILGAAGSAEEEGDELASIETVLLQGTPSMDSFDCSLWTAGTLVLRGQGGFDTIQAAVPVRYDAEDEPIGGSITLQDNSILFPDLAGTITFSQIEKAILIGSPGNDALDARAATLYAVLRGGAGNDTLIGGPGLNELYGEAGNDTFVFYPGGGAFDADGISGGDGVDTLDFHEFRVDLTIDLSIVGVVQTVATDGLRVVLGSLVEDEIVWIEDLENVVGGSGADTLLGNSLNNAFTGGPGRDTLIDGRSGQNWIVADADADMTLMNTSLRVGTAEKPLANVQHALLTGGPSANILDASAFAGDVMLSGRAGADTLLGGSGDDVLAGEGGDDLLRGGAGNDTYLFDADLLLGTDTVDELPGAAGGFDTLSFALTQKTTISIDLGSTARQTVEASNLRLTLVSGASIESVVGGDQADTLRGNSLDNVLVGGPGSDTIDGGPDGRDTIQVTWDANMRLTNTTLVITEPSSDAAVENDTLRNIDAAVLLGGAGQNTLDASRFTAGPVILSGLGGNDTLIGGYGNDQLFGGEGDDLVFGGCGADLLFGGDGNDSLNGCGVFDQRIVDRLGVTDGNDELHGGRGNDTYEFVLAYTTLRDLAEGASGPMRQGTDRIFETVNEGFADTIRGLGLSGIGIDLHSTSPQSYYDLADPHAPLLLRVILNHAGEIELAY